ncbi:NAD(P)H-binding protein [Frankia sp. CNm7]|uniref:NAD(P)H-binding protein n=1 Tax=Frankia nepalensis TaxID=1836974 RepID=A0A937RRC9_9ACTN|nr:NAD(P)H-binding protein [Frankia nepalensis]MBL7502053.1 NAD(P)H-binding protein [Frankia nepalensis]MBL7511959.1 NAD(P)H-binding protein [Frankia nepalensis]MBL7524051.1 NAD(P)H-binding protein [Frankia nepalensis]MBL7630551.1 NAD(P)H-binding protein [Frankia nepalensis]
MIVVTGATGHLGRLVIADLLSRAVPAAGIAAVVRDRARAADLATSGVEIRVADYEQPRTLPGAFAGADKLLFISSVGPDDARLAQHHAVVDAAAEAGVGLLAYTSIVQADTSPLRLAEIHRATEKAIATTGLPSVILRNGWYTENHTAALPTAVQLGALVGGAGQGRIASASRADFATAAAAVLTTPGHAGRVYELTGDTAWNLPELAAELSARTGRAIGYQNLSASEYTAILTGAGLPGYLAELLVDADLRIAEGALATVTDDLRTLIGRPSTPLSESVAAALGDG